LTASTLEFYKVVAMSILRQVLAPALVVGMLILLPSDVLLVVVAIFFLGGVISGRWIALASVPLGATVAALIAALIESDDRNARPSEFSAEAEAFIVIISLAAVALVAGAGAFVSASAERTLRQAQRSLRAHHR
jgi:hypothetical protein